VDEGAVLNERLHSQLPLANGGLDNLIGVVPTKEFLAAYNAAGDSSVLSLLAQPPIFIPETLGLDRVLKTFQESGAHLLFVVDEYGGVEGVVTLRDVLNELLVEHPVTPCISGHDAQAWHLHVADTQRSVAEQVASEGVLGLAMLVCELGARRLGVCHSSPCTNVYVDTSPNLSRRYCSERCSSRANVAAYRARRRVTAGPAGARA
jgi:hypothetical protein